MAVAITCGYGGYLLPLLAAHSSLLSIYQRKWYVIKQNKSTWMYGSYLSYIYNDYIHFSGDLPIISFKCIFIGWDFKWNVSCMHLRLLQSQWQLIWGFYVCHWPFFRKLVCWELDGCEWWTCKTPIEVLLVSKNRILGRNHLQCIILLPVLYEIWYMLSCEKDLFVSAIPLLISYCCSPYCHVHRFYYTHRTTKLFGVYWFHSVRLSVRLSVRQSARPSVPPAVSAV